MLHFKSKTDMLNLSRPTLAKMPVAVLSRVLRRHQRHRIIAPWVMLTETRIKLVPSDDIVSVHVVSGHHAVRHGLLLSSIQGAMIRCLWWRRSTRPSTDR